MKKFHKHSALWKKLFQSTRMILCFQLIICMELEALLLPVSHVETVKTSNFSLTYSNDFFPVSNKIMQYWQLISHPCTQFCLIVWWLELLAGSDSDHLAHSSSMYSVFVGCAQDAYISVDAHVHH